MDGSIFRFKHFQVRNERSAMKVNTDGVLLGAAVGLEGLATSADDGIRVLDAGTGTGTIALMIAQRLKALGKECHILGIDIDAVSAEEAAAKSQAQRQSKQLLSILGKTFVLIHRKSKFTRLSTPHFIMPTKIYIIWQPKVLILREWETLLIYVLLKKAPFI